MSNYISDMAVIMQKPILTAQEAALYLGVTMSHLYKKTMRKEIPFYKPEGKIIYFDREELEGWMKRNRVASNDEILSRVQTDLVLGKKGGKQ